MTTRSKAKPVGKATAAVEVRKNYYVGQALDSLYHFGTTTSIDKLVKSSSFETMAVDEDWEGEILLFLEVDDNDNITTHKYRLVKTGYAVEKP